MAVDVDERCTTSPWRPVQFLGSKLRSLDLIAEAVRRLGSASATVWEPFSGSSVVSQRLASEGHRVWSADALASSATIATAMLGVGRPTDQTDLVSLAEAAVDHARLGVAPGWDLWVRQERQALSDGDGARLLAESQCIPQRWRPAGADRELTSLFTRVEAYAAAGMVSTVGLLSATYAGTYFGLGQSLELEALRGAVDAVTAEQGPGASWARATLLTALCHAASAAVFSPGKHFAQPHRVRDGKDLTFHAQRALQDRSVDVADEFLLATRTIERTARPSDEGHVAEHRLVGDTTAADLRTRGVSVAYADPPYTAQQYSRFYHLLDTLVTGVPPALQRVQGEVTRGLYPEGRYLSPFSSRRQAPQAFRDLIRVAHLAGASVVLSYSAARGSATGNARIVSLEEIVGWVGEAYGVAAVSVDRLDLRYRQFNSSRAGVAGREDPEFLVVGDAHAR